MIKKFAIMAALFLGAAIPATAQVLRAITAETLSPFSRSMDEAQPGFNVELVRAIAVEAGYDLVVDVLPWKRAQAVATSEPDLLIFGLTRNAAREENYEWVTNLLTVRRVFATIGEPVHSTEDARRLNHIAARSIYFKALEADGLANVEEGETDGNLRKLRAGRVDAVFTLATRAIHEWTRELGFPRSELVLGDTVATSELWLAASTGYDPAVMRELDAALTRLHANGTYAELFDAYFGDLEGAVTIDNAFATDAVTN